MQRETANSAGEESGGKHAFLEGATHGVLQLEGLTSVCRVGFQELGRRPGSARQSASLLPSTVTCTGTLIHLISLSG